MTCARCGAEGFGCYECTPDPYAEISRLTAERNQLAAQYTTACQTIDKLATERDQAITALSKAAEARGRAEGKLAASELPGIIDMWMVRALMAREEVERLRAHIVNLQTTWTLGDLQASDFENALQRKEGNE